LKYPIRASGAESRVHLNSRRYRCGIELKEALLATCFLAGSLTAAADPGVTQGVPLRNQNPFLQIFGLPPFQSAALTAGSALDYRVSFDIVNHAELGANMLEDISIDGESHFLTLSLRRGMTDRFELGLDIPFVGHAGGFLDNAIESWHDLLGLSNSKRRGPDNQLGIRYSNAGLARYELNSAVFGIGDIQLTAAMPLRRADYSDPFSAAIRSSIKIPTGAADELRGSGAADLSLGLYASDRYTVWQRDFAVSAFAGMLFLGDGDVLPDLQRSTVPYGGVAASWWISERFGVSAQLQAEGPYFDSDVDELGGYSAQLAAGFDLRLRKPGMSLHFSITEDIAAGTTTTPDFGVHLSIRRAGRN